LLCGNHGYPYHTITSRKKSNTTIYTLHFDNVFNNYGLLVKLCGLKMRGIETMLPNRRNGADAVILPDKEVMKQKRGAFDFRSDGNVYISKWYYNSIGRIASNFLKHRPLGNTQRRVKGQRIETMCCVSSNNTNQKMVLAFINMVNAASMAAGRIHCFVEEIPRSHLELHRQVVLSLLQSERTATPRAASGFMSQMSDIRFDGVNHILGTGPQGRYKVCKGNTKFMCQNCNVRLHAE
ncbi:PiggyBac transposable element-derived protein 3, partial [Trichinella nelsoni]